MTESYLIRNLFLNILKYIHKIFLYVLKIYIATVCMYLKQNRVTALKPEHRETDCAKIF